MQITQAIVLTNSLASRFQFLLALPREFSATSASVEAF